MLRLILGGVTLAAAGFAAKEYCEENGCPWEDSSFSSSYEKDDETVNYKKSLAFHKQKKEFYKTAMKTYSKFLTQYNIQDDTIQTDAKLLKQRFADEIIDDEISSYMDKITATLEILSHNLTLGIKLVKINGGEKVDEESLSQLQAYARSIYALAHAPFFLDEYSGEVLTKLKEYDSIDDALLNKEGLLSVLVEAMSLAVQKESIHVDLSGELDAIATAQNENTLQ